MHVHIDVDASQGRHSERRVCRLRQAAPALTAHGAERDLDEGRSDTKG